MQSYIITSHNEVVAKVMFLLEFVILFTGGWGVCLSACWDTTPQSRHPPPPRSRHPPLGEQTSYWNATLYYYPRSCGADSSLSPGVEQIPPPWEQTPPRSRHSPRSRHTTPPEQTAPLSRHPPEQTPTADIPWCTHPPEQKPPPRSRHPTGVDTPLGADTPPWEQTHPPGADTPLGADTPPRGADSSPPGADTPPEANSGIRSMSGRYASYWNAFLLTCCSWMSIYSALHCL